MRGHHAPEVLDVRAEFAARGITVPIGRMLTAAETQARKPGISNALAHRPVPPVIQRIEAKLENLTITLSTEEN